MRLRRVMAAVVAALFVAGFPASAAGGDGGHPVVVYNAGAQDDSPGIPSGANNWNCKPSQEHPNPVVLVHGLGGAAGTNWGYIAPQLAAQGYCVFALTYGKPPGFPPISGGFAPMENSAPELADFVDRVLAATGAPKVDLVGHSEGTVMPQYYLKFLGGAPKVQRYVALTPLYDGTTLNNSSEILNRLATEVPVLGTLPDQACGSCREFFKDSDFMHKLNAGGAAVPGIEYTTIMTKYDELVTPYTSGYLDGARQNIVLQDVCSQDYAEHVAVAVDPHVARLVLNALDPGHAQPVTC